MRLRLKLRWPLAGIAALGLFFFCGEKKPAVPSSSPSELTPAFSPPIPRNFPAQDTLSWEGRLWTTCYAPDTLLQARAFRYLSRYRPEGAVIALCDLRSGTMLVLAERDSAGSRSNPRMALESGYPAASLIKILTAAAALEWNGADPSDSLPMLGRGHTLYRYQLRLPERGHTPRISLRDAFARSVNPAFGLLGLRLGAEPLRKMGEAMGFNRPGPMPEWGASRLEIPDTGFGLAEVACGFTAAATISPMHALQIARGVGDDGRLYPPRFTREMRALEDGRSLSMAETDSKPFLSPAALDHLRTMMAATVTTGTARKGFLRNLRREDMEPLELGGKTGSLDGPMGAHHGDPPRGLGRYEWYIGYARLKETPDEGIALAIMLINQRTLAVHAAELASLMIRDWERSVRKRLQGGRGPGYAAR